MDLPLWLQYALIALALAASALVVMKRQFPTVTRRLRVACALPLLRGAKPAWMHRLGRWIAPEGHRAGKDCGGCDGCEPR